MNYFDNNYSYLFSSFEPLPDHFFQGYCFVENDLVIGKEGAEQYPKTIPPFCDGCYVSLIREQGSYIIGTDSSGFKKIYLYDKNGIVNPK